MNPTHKYFLYARKSTDEKSRQVYSIEHQLAELRQLALRKNVQVLAEFEEKQTAMDPGRPIFNSILQRIRNGEADGILAWHPDRLSRNSYDSYQVIHMVESKTLQLEFASYTFAPTPEGILTLGIAFDMAKYSSAVLSVNINRAQRRRLLEGHWPFKQPVGYLFDRNARRVVIDPDRAPLIREAFELYATSEYSIDQLQRIMTDRGLTRRSFKGKPPGSMSRSHYHCILRDPFYVGLMSHGGELFQGQHEPLVSTQIYDACQEVLGQKGNYRSSTLKAFLYRGMFMCGKCDGMVTMEMHKGHTYMRCTKTRGQCPQGYLRQEMLAKLITRSLRRLLVPEDLILLLILDLEEMQRSQIAQAGDKFKKIKAEIDTCERKLERLNTTYIESTMPLESFNVTKGKLLKLKLVLSEKLAFAQSHRKTPLEPVIRFVRGLTEARNVIEGTDELQKRDLLQKAGSNLKIKDANVFWSPRGPWKTVAEIGRLARVASREQNAPELAHEKRPLKCRVSGALRTQAESLCLWFKEHLPESHAISEDVTDRS